MVERDPYVLPVGKVPGRISNLPIHSMATPGWKIIQMPWGSVYGPFSPHILRDVAYWSDIFLQMLRRELQVKAELPIHVRILHPDELYECYCMRCEKYEIKPAEGTSAFFMIDYNEINIPWTPLRGRMNIVHAHNIQESIAHELTHLYVMMNFGFLGPAWFSEGIAEYFSKFTMERGRPIPGILETEEYYTAYDLMQNLSLMDFIILSHDQFQVNPEKMAKNYSLACVFVAYLSEKEGILSVLHKVLDGRIEEMLDYENDFRKYLESVVNQGPPPGYQYGEIISH
jgi:hypothetical protein